MRANLKIDFPANIESDTVIDQTVGTSSAAAIVAAEPCGGHLKTKDSSSADQKVYHVGSLRYTTRTLIVLFTWMLWGDFCFTLMETVVPSILPLKLKSLGASNFSMALIMTTLPGILNCTVCPWVSFRSDRHRGPWGRRIPFIMWTAPFLTLFLILLGFSEQISRWTQQTFFNGNWFISQTVVTVFLVGVFMVCFTFFNMFVNSVYWYLFNDVVPDVLLGRFLGLFRVVAGLVGVLYNFYILPHAVTHMKEIFLGAAVLYLLGFGLMCLKVKEGQYPPPPENLEGKSGLWAGIKTFGVECYSLRYYWYFFLAAAFSAMATGCISAFSILFSMEIGLNLTQIGKILGSVTIVYTLLTYPAGILADRFHPLRVLIGCMIAMVIIAPINLIYLFFNFEPQMVIYLSLAVSMISLPISLMYSSSDLPMYMRVLPKERFGQFCSATALVRSAGMILGGLMAGYLLDVLKGIYPGTNFCYRFIPLWTWIFQMAGLICLLLLYRGWKKYGGPDHYVAPNVGKNSSGEVH